MWRRYELRHGSIPACAGEPGEHGAVGICCGVYPRLRGGTGAHGSHLHAGEGLSPLARGNHWPRRNEAVA